MKIFLAFHVDGVQELVPRAAGHHDGVHAFSFPVQGDRVAHAEQVVPDGEEGHVAFHVFFIGPLQGDGVQGPGFFEAADAEEGEKVLPLLFRFL